MSSSATLSMSRSVPLSMTPFLIRSVQAAMNSNVKPQLKRFAPQSVTKNAPLLQIASVLLLSLLIVSPVRSRSAIQSMTLSMNSNAELTKKRDAELLMRRFAKLSTNNSATQSMSNSVTL